MLTCNADDGLPVRYFPSKRIAIAQVIQCALPDCSTSVNARNDSVLVASGFELSVERIGSVYILILQFL